jgi:hypothetical protein
MEHYTELTYNNIMNSGRKITGTRQGLFIITIIMAGIIIICVQKYQTQEKRLVEKHVTIPHTQENGAWLWTDPLRITTSYRDSIIKTAKENNIDTIYITLDSYIGLLSMTNEVEKEKQSKLFNIALEDFLQIAHNNGITVDAEVGAPDWAEDEKFERADMVLEYVKEFNKTHTVGFRGFQYDVESYTLPQFTNNKKDVLTKFLNMIDHTITKLENTNLQFSVAIPDFYDTNSPDTPKFIYNKKLASVYTHLLSILDRKPASTIIIMVYHDHAIGQGGVIEASQDEITEAENSLSRIIIALEVGEVENPGISFYNKPKKDYLDTVQQIQKVFASTTSYGGVATDHIDALKELK